MRKAVVFLSLFYLPCHALNYERGRELYLEGEAKEREGNREMAILFYIEASDQGDHKSKLALKRLLNNARGLKAFQEFLSPSEIYTLSRFLYYGKKGKDYPQIIYKAQIFKDLQGLLYEFYRQRQYQRLPIFKQMFDRVAGEILIRFSKDLKNQANFSQAALHLIEAERIYHSEEASRLLEDFSKGSEFKKAQSLFESQQVSKTSQALSEVMEALFFDLTQKALEFQKKDPRLATIYTLEALAFNIPDARLIKLEKLLSKNPQERMIFEDFRRSKSLNLLGFLDLKDHKASFLTSLLGHLNTKGVSLFEEGEKRRAVLFNQVALELISQNELALEAVKELLKNPDITDFLKSKKISLSLGDEKLGNFLGSKEFAEFLKKEEISSVLKKNEKIMRLVISQRVVNFLGSHRLKTYKATQKPLRSIASPKAIEFPVLGEDWPSRCKEIFRQEVSPGLEAIH